MKLLILGFFVYLILNGGLTGYSCFKKAPSLSGTSKMTISIIQTISGMLFLIAIQYLFQQYSVGFWVCAAGAILLIVCGFINCIAYMCSQDGR